MKILKTALLVLGTILSLAVLPAFVVAHPSAGDNVSLDIDNALPEFFRKRVGKVSEQSGSKKVNRVLSTRENAEGLIREVEKLAGRTGSDALKTAASQVGRAGVRSAATDIRTSANRLLPGAKALSANTPEGAKAWNAARSRFQSRGSVQVRPGLLTGDGRLLVSMESGAAAGFLVFVADAGVACYQYHQGSILDADFGEQIADAAIKGAVVGTAVAVAVMLGATPAGWCVLAVSTVAYIVVDVGLRIWHKIQDWPYLREEDLAAFGIELDSILKPRDTIFDMDDGFLVPNDSPLAGF